MRLLIAILLLVPWLAQAAAPVAKFPSISLNAQTNVLSANATNLTFTGGYTTLSNSVKVFSVGYPSGDLSIIKSVPYSWPVTNAAGALQNDGSGNLAWSGFNFNLTGTPEAGSVLAATDTNGVNWAWSNTQNIAIGNDAIANTAPTNYWGDSSSRYSPAGIMLGTVISGDLSAVDNEWATIFSAYLYTHTGTSLAPVVGFDIEVGTTADSVGPVNLTGLYNIVRNRGTTATNGMTWGEYTDASSVYGPVYGSKTTVSGTGYVDPVYGFYSRILDGLDTYGFYAEKPSGSHISYNATFYAQDMAGAATNTYYSWFDSRGVRRVKEDSTFNSVGQAIEALYNPQFTKYTAGATNYERVVLGQWNSNVSEIGNEAAGTGTLRPLRLIGSAFEAGSTNQWKFLGMTVDTGTTNLNFNVNGQNFRCAATPY